MAPTSQKTPAKASAAAGKMKQKSLMSFFGKAPAASGSKAATAESSSTKKTSAAKNKPAETRDASEAADRVDDDAPSSDPPAGARTPLSKNASLSSVVRDANYTRSSDGASSFAQTPPTSDPIDVDMLSAEEDEGGKTKSGSKASVCHSTFCFHDYTHDDCDRLARYGRNAR